MKIEDIKNRFINVGLNYDFFHFNHQVIDGVRYYFPIQSIRSYKNHSATIFYKAISRNITILTKEHDEQ